MRYECEEPGFEGAYLEMTDKGWTRKALNQLRTLDESDAWFGVLAQYVTAVHLPTLDGEPVQAAGQITPDALDRLDIVLYNWFVSALSEALADVTNLGNAPWRRLRERREATATNSQTPQ